MEGTLTLYDAALELESIFLNLILELSDNINAMEDLLANTPRTLYTRPGLQWAMEMKEEMMEFYEEELQHIKEVKDRAREAMVDQRD